MFEAAIHSSVPVNGAILRPLEWGELVARFGAARDLRALTARAPGNGGSFIIHAADGLGYDTDHCAGQDQPGVNLAALGGVKPLEAITAGTTNAMAESDQGTR
ncbi:hypothetical protein A6F68_00381 [Tsuneonella dongtanensis]|uniref:Uncharacterized protein n=1 Tax=Tsuneonella dongtanensis TaxID=692370 RepID=A0A1B2A9U0_9SPHN|nr:hypothetical protein [Tsuneonella dongtanensis]ANY18916.1 hypothetical protein A6F68_00381 [Tsuneonella dongtanensis]